MSSDIRDQLLRDLYGSFSEDVRLEESLVAIAPLLKSHVIGLHTEDFGATRAQVLIKGVLDANDVLEHSRWYAERHLEENLWIRRSIDGYLRQGFQHTDAVATDAELLASTYYQRCLKPLDIRHGVGICLWSDRKDSFVVTTINRRASVGPIDKDDIALIRWLRPHLVNLYAIYRRLARLETAVGSLRASLDRLPIGVLVMDADGRILECNSAASVILESPAGIARSVESKLTIQNRLNQQQLRTALNRLSTDPAPSPETVFIAPSPDRTLGGLVLHLCALPGAVAGLLARRANILGFLYDIGQFQADKARQQMLRAIFGLTTNEARVALLIREYADIEQVAARMGVAISTVRTHLKHAFQKTCTRRQSELALLVDRLIWIAPR